MPIAAPSYTCTITAPNGSPLDFTKYLAFDGAFNQFMITQNFGRQGDTADIPLMDDWAGQGAPNIIIPPESQIKLVDNNISKTIFAGVVVDPILTPRGPNLNEWHLKCTDYTTYADNSTPVFGPYFNGYTADQVVVMLTEQANCGITAKPVSQGGFVAPAVQLPSVAIDYQPLSTAWRTLATLASQVTPYGWYVDENLELHFYDSTTAQSSGAQFTTVPTTGGSAVEGHALLDTQFQYEWDGTTIHNRILVRGANQTIQSPLFGNPTDTWVSNGFQTAWPLRYVYSGSNELLVGTTQTQVTELQPGEPETGASNWYASQNANGAWFLVTTSAPPAGTVIKFWYDYQIPVTAIVNDTTSQTTYDGPNRGIFGEFISDSTLSTTSMALARALRERQEYAFAVERIQFNSSADFLGYVRAGETFTFSSPLIPDSANNYDWGINSTFLCIANMVTFVQGGYRQMQIQGVRV